MGAGEGPSGTGRGERGSRPLGTRPSIRHFQGCHSVSAPREGARIWDFSAQNDAGDEQRRWGLTGSRTRPQPERVQAPSQHRWGILMGNKSPRARAAPNAGSPPGPQRRRGGGFGAISLPCSLGFCSIPSFFPPNHTTAPRPELSSAGIWLLRDLRSSKKLLEPGARGEPGRFAGAGCHCRQFSRRIRKNAIKGKKIKIKIKRKTGEAGPMGAEFRAGRAGGSSATHVYFGAHRCSSCRICRSAKRLRRRQVGDPDGSLVIPMDPH